MIHSIKSKLRKAGELEKNSIILFVIMMSGNFLNYLFQIFMGRQLGVKEYGELSALLSIIAILGVLSLVIAMLSAKYTVQFIVGGQRAILRLFILKMFIIVAISSAVLLTLGVICSPWIASALKINNNKLIIFTIITGSLSIFASVLLGVLQGLKRFVYYGIMSFISIAGKLVLSILLVMIGWHLYGPLTGFILGIALSMGYGFICIRDMLRKPDTEQSLNFKWNEFIQFAGKVLLIQVLISVITNGDILLVKYYFSEHDAGLYSSAMVIGKISMYAAMAIVAALFPMTMEHVENGKSTRQLLIKSLLYSGGIAVLCAIVLNVFSGFIISTLYGNQYLPSTAYLLPVSAFVIPVTLYTVMMNYQLATGQTRPLVYTLIGSVIMCWLIIININKSINAIILIIAVTLMCGVIIDLLLVISSRTKSRLSI